MARRRRFASRSDFAAEPRAWRRWLRRSLLSLLGLAVILGLAVFGVLWSTLPPDDQTLHIPGLSAPVDITFDGNGVPRIRAANEKDAALAVGFVHARDRMFQMDLMRRAASGRLSEIAGPVTLAYDKQMRVFGLARLAEADVAAQSPETRELLTAYAAGVNAWIDSRGRFSGIEFLLLGTPDPWRPADSLMWGRSMGLLLSSNYRTELTRQALRDKLSPRALEQLWPPHPPPLRPEAMLNGMQPVRADLWDPGVAMPALTLNVMAGPDPAISSSILPRQMAGSGPAMTDWQRRADPRFPVSAATLALTPSVMAGPDPAISSSTLRRKMAGSGPAMTNWQRRAGPKPRESARIFAHRAVPDQYRAAPGQCNQEEHSPATTATAIALLSILPAFPAPFTLPATASNAWAVDGRWSETGAPLLAGDPHLGFGFPGLWYLIRVETPGHVLAGATGPGVPFLVMGHNGQIAWTFTTNGADTQDVYLEPPDTKFTTREERIKVRGQPDTILMVRESRHGPVISDLASANAPVMAVAMANLLPNDTAASGLLAMNRARTVEEAGKAAALISAPVQNVIVADRTKIALFVTGRVPIRRAGDGWSPVQGAGAPNQGAKAQTSAQGIGDPYGWSGFASGEALPHVIAPASGRLVNANEPVAPPDFPVFMGRDTFSDWRARRIRTLLDSVSKHSVSEFAAVQTDVISTYAAALLPALREVPGAPQVLRDWDGAMTETAPQPLIFSAWMDAFHSAVMARAGIPVHVSAPVFEFVPFVLSPAGASWCGGDCAALLKSTLDSTMSSLAARFGPDPGAWRWGAVHQAVFAHPFLRAVPVLGAVTTARIAVPGDGTTIDSGGTDDLLESVHGASYRGVYDLADLDRSLFVVTPGQSGNPLSRHAWDFLTRWRDGAMVLLTSKPAEISGVVRLEP